MFQMPLGDRSSLSFPVQKKYLDVLCMHRKFQSWDRWQLDKCYLSRLEIVNKSSMIVKCQVFWDGHRVLSTLRITTKGSWQRTTLSRQETAMVMLSGKCSHFGTRKIHLLTYCLVLQGIRRRKLIKGNVFLPLDRRGTKSFAKCVNICTCNFHWERK